MQLIDRKTARCLVGDKAFRVLTTSPEAYETLLVEPEGIKLFRRREGRHIVYGIYGYERQERDVRRALQRCSKSGIGKALLTVGLVTLMLGVPFVPFI